MMMKMLPLLVAVWAAAAIVGGAAHQAGAETDQGTKDAIVEAGAKICVASMALIAGFRPVRYRRPVLVRWSVPAFLSPRTESPGRFLYPPTPKAPRLHLLQILRT